MKWKFLITYGYQSEVHTDIIEADTMLEALEIFGTEFQPSSCIMVYI